MTAKCSNIPGYIYYDMSSEYLADGIPWCAIDRENGYLYTSQFHNVGEILQYDLETMTFLRAIPLEEKLDRIQGGSVYNGMLYLSYDAANSTQEQIIAVDPNTGRFAWSSQDIARTMTTRRRMSAFIPWRTARCSMLSIMISSSTRM